jgi:hypothetical protein
MTPLRRLHGSKRAKLVGGIVFFALISCVTLSFVNLTGHGLFVAVNHGAFVLSVSEMSSMTPTTPASVRSITRMPSVLTAGTVPVGRHGSAMKARSTL